MKRLFVTCDFPPISGGQSNYFKNLWSQLNPEQDMLLVPRHSREYCVQAKPGRITYARLPAGEGWVARMLRLVILAFSVIRVCARFRPNEIHAGQLLAGGISCLVCKRLFNVQYIPYVFGADILEFQQKAFGRWLVRAVLENSRHIVACSNFTAGFIREKFKPQVPVSVVNPGVEDRFFTSSPKAMEALREQLGVRGKKVLLTVGRLVERKGHEMVIRALPEVLRSFPGLSYVISGSGPNLQRLQQAVREASVENHVIFAGAIPDSGLPALYAIADAFIMVSFHLPDKGDIEGFGIVYLEANAAGVPVIAARIGGVPDAVHDQETGILINEPLTPEKTANAICAVLHNPPRFSGKAVAWAQSMRWGKQCAKWEEAIRS